MWNLTSFFLKTVLASVQDRCIGYARHTIGSEILLDPLVAWLMWALTSFSLETVLVSVQDRCTVCAKRSIGLDIVYGAPDGTAR